MWVIRCGEGYVTGNLKNPNITYEFKKAKKFKDKSQASSYMVHTHSKVKGTTTVELCSYLNPYSNVQQEQTQSKSSISKELIKRNDISVYFSSEENNINKQIEIVENIFSQLDTYKEKLTQDFKRLERELCDIDHKMELTKDLNAAEGYKLYALRTKKLRERRLTKDGLLKIGILHETKLEDIKNRKVSPRLNGMDNRTYTPRELTELFD